MMFLPRNHELILFSRGCSCFFEWMFSSEMTQRLVGMLKRVKDANDCIFSDNLRHPIDDVLLGDGQLNSLLDSRHEILFKIGLDDDGC